MPHPLRLGRVSCDIIRKDAFLALCGAWLEGSSLRHIVTLNAEMVVQAERDRGFQKAVMQADLRIPDGAGILWAKQYLASQSQLLLTSLAGFFLQKTERLSGVDVLFDICRLAEQRGLCVYLLGSLAQEREKTAQALTRRFPSLQVRISSDHAYSITGPAHIIQDIQSHKPAILLIAYGAPKQTLWIEAMRGCLPSVRIAMGVGGAFAMISNRKPRSPLFLRRHNIEWLWRLFLEPARARRIFRATIQFPILIHRQKARQ